MRSRNLIKLAAVVAVGVLVTGCSGSNSDSPLSSAPPATSSASTTSLPAGAPAVPQALSTQALEDNPCSVITAEQIASLGVPSKNIGLSPAGLPSACLWRFATESPSSVTGSLSAGGPGISGIYLKQQQGGFTAFEPFTAAGYPGAVFANTSNPDPGHCSLSIGLRDDTTYDFSISLSSATTPLGDPCEVGKKLSALVVEYLQQHQS